MDGSWYRMLLEWHISINNHTLSHMYFSDHHDIALGLVTDDFEPFHHCNKTVWPLIIFNYNLPPEIHFHLNNILSLGVIPGPKKPHDLDSFLWPLIQELLHLEISVHVYDALLDGFFILRAFLILIFDDIPAIAMLMKMKGHNGYCPCCMCTIKGICIPNAWQPTLYVPLDCSCHPEVARASADIIWMYDPQSRVDAFHIQVWTVTFLMQHISHISRWNMNCMKNSNSCPNREN